MDENYLIRGQKVPLERDLADLYGVQTRVLKQAVRRNINRFPFDFMFELTKEELEDWRSQFVTSKGDKKGLRYPLFTTYHRQLTTNAVKQSLTTDVCTAGQQPLHSAY